MLRSKRHFFEAEALREEIIVVGRKLWERQYVDGNGGNISVRLGENYLLCTPTMMSKRDMVAGGHLPLRPGRQHPGRRPHAHQRSAAASGHLQGQLRRPRRCSLPSAARHGLRDDRLPAAHRADLRVRDLDWPGSGGALRNARHQAFAETVLPFVQDHNTILLSNHGIVCWSDTVTHAEWLVETFETYCKTYLIAQQIGRPLNFLPTTARSMSCCS
jgi:L-fuculose-phosphate aldolase